MLRRYVGRTSVLLCLASNHRHLRYFGLLVLCLLYILYASFFTKSRSTIQTLNLDIVHAWVQNIRVLHFPQILSILCAADRSICAKMGSLPGGTDGIDVLLTVNVGVTRSAPPRPMQNHQTLVFSGTDYLSLAAPRPQKQGRGGDSRESFQRLVQLLGMLVCGAIYRCPEV